MRASPRRQFEAGELEQLAGDVVAALERQAAAAGDEFERSELAALAARVRAAGVVLVDARASAGPDPAPRVKNAIGARIRPRRPAVGEPVADPANGQQRARTAARRPQSPASSPARPARTGSRPGGPRGSAGRGA